MLLVAESSVVRTAVQSPPPALRLRKLLRRPQAQEPFSEVGVTLIAQFP